MVFAHRLTNITLLTLVATRYTVFVRGVVNLYP